MDFFQDQIDLAIRIRRTEQSGIQEERIGQFRILLVCAPDYADTLELDQPANLARARFISPRRQHAREFDQALKALGVGRDQIQIYLDDVTSVQSLLQQGFGVGFLPELLVREALEDKALVSLDYGRDPGRSSLYATYPYEFRNSKRVQLVLSRIRAAMSAFD